MLIVHDDHVYVYVVGIVLRAVCNTYTYHHVFRVSEQARIVYQPLYQAALAGMLMSLDVKIFDIA